jgi:hypothetical protein
MRVFSKKGKNMVLVNTNGKVEMSTKAILVLIKGKDWEYTNGTKGDIIRGTGMGIG